ncbi:hypothetical protein S83_067334, partial [Arachis hypogaea]
MGTILINLVVKGVFSFTLVCDRLRFVLELFQNPKGTVFEFGWLDLLLSGSSLGSSPNDNSSDGIKLDENEVWQFRFAYGNTWQGMFYVCDFPNDNSQRVRKFAQGMTRFLLLIAFLWMLKRLSAVVSDRKGSIAILCSDHLEALSNGQSHSLNGYRKSCWYEEEIEDNLRWCFALNSILDTGASQYQDIALLDTKTFGKEVVDFCKSYLVANGKTFCNPRLRVIINDARAELEAGEERFDVIVGDLADPIDGGPCYKLYTKFFYDFTVKPRPKEGGIFVTQAGPAGIFRHTEVFSSIYNTLRQMLRLTQLISHPMLISGDGS